METSEVHPQCRHQSSQAGDEVQRLENDVGGAIAVRCFEGIAHVALRREGPPISGHSRAGDIAARNKTIAPV